MTSELHARGAAMRRELYGEAAADRSAQSTYADPMMAKFLDVATENVFGALWTRPGLDLKTRTMVCVVSDVATGRAALARSNDRAGAPPWVARG